MFIHKSRNNLHKSCNFYGCDAMRATKEIYKEGNELKLILIFRRCNKNFKMRFENFLCMTTWYL